MNVTDSTAGSIIALKSGQTKSAIALKNLSDAANDDLNVAKLALNAPSGGTTTPERGNLLNIVV